MGRETLRPTRREMLSGIVGAGAVGAHHSNTLTSAAVGTYYSLGNWDFEITDATVDSSELEPGDRVEIHARIENTGQKAGTVSSWLGIRRPDGSRLYPDSQKTYDLTVGDSVLEKYTWRIPSDGKTGQYSFTVDLYDAHGDHMFDTTGFETNFHVRDAISDLYRSASAIQWTRIKGMFYGEFGLHMDVEGAQSIPYFLGWLEASIVPGLDIVADVRDCIALDDWGSNVIDCSGALVSTIGSAGTVLGVAGVIVPEPVTSAAGLGVLGTSLSIDTAEDISDVARITEEFLQRADDLTARVSDILRMKFSGTHIGKIANNIDDAATKQDLVDMTSFKETYAPVGIVSEMKLTAAKYSEKFLKSGHLDLDEVRETVEHADRVYQGVLKSGGDHYWWVKKLEDGKVAVVKGTDLSTIGDSGSTGLRVNDGWFWESFDAVEDKAVKAKMTAIHTR